MGWRLKQQIWPHWETLVVSAGVSALVIAAGAKGLLQPFELFALDTFFRLSITQKQESRVLVVGIDEADLSTTQQWPLPDQVMAEVLQKIRQHHPRGIGLDIYRNFAVEPGHEALAEVFRSTPELIGVEKVISPPVAPPPILKQLNQVGMSDLVVDDDGRLRRALLTIATEDEQIKAGLATRLALMYLQQENIYPQELTGKRQPLQLGKTLFQRLEKNDGGYVNIDDGGYQILFNFRGPADAFETVSLSEILQGQLSAEQVQDRIVLIGTVAPSINDLFYTSHSGSHRVPGVVVHAQIVSQILEAALDGQPLLRVAPDPIEWAWLLSWTTLGAVAVKALLHWRSHQLGKLEMPAGILLLQCCLAGASYLLFWQGLWLPVVAPLVSMLAASVVTLMLQNQQLYGLATFDGLTRVANRRSFDQHLKQVLQQQKELSLVLCDVDYFKRYNDTYGHQAGDSCLQQVAQALRSGVRKSDLVARYGGEEFALILPHASAAVAQEVIQRIQTHIERLSIPHAGSEVNPYVTISYGIAHTSGHPNPLPSELIQQADDALYQAKRAGRNRAVVVSMAES